MKKSIVMFVFAMATLSFVSCKDEAKEETTVEATEASNDEMHMASYVCPMDCEKGKTYDAAGKCPVCKMDLVESHEGHDHENHEGHNH